MRIGAVNYLNSKPLVSGLDAAPGICLTFDLPSRLADSLAAKRLDVALIPSVEFFRTAGHRIVSDACVACRGPVLSVKLHFRVPPHDVRTLALDEGSRTSAALSQIVLAERCGVRPTLERLPIGSGIEATKADAVLLIGDRAIADCGFPAAAGELLSDCRDDAAEENPQSARSLPGDPRFLEIWDLGQTWTEWTGLPFVFAMWIAREGVVDRDVASLLEDARDRGESELDQIAEREAPLVGISRELAERYLRDNLHFTLGSEERAGLRKFYDLCVKHDLAPPGIDSTLSANPTANAER